MHTSIPPLSPKLNIHLDLNGREEEKKINVSKTICENVWIEWKINIFNAHRVAE